MNDREYHETVIIGAGFAGISALYHATKAGLETVLLEEGSAIGGTWHWNSYPDARTDTEAWYYSYSFEPEKLRQWRWRERFPSGTEVQGFLSFVATELELYPMIRFGQRVTRLEFDPHQSVWAVTTSDGATIDARFVITAVGGLSAPNVPNIPGIDNFTGKTVVSSRWATTGLDVTGKRVGVVGTGSTGVQIVTAIAPIVDDLYVMQRTPNYVLPRNNHVISDEQWHGILDNYDQIWHRIRRHYFAYPLELTGRKAKESTDQERTALFEEMWRKGGFALFLEAYDDLAVDEESNEFAAEFIRAKIRQAVADPATAEALTPKMYPFGGKRPVVGSGYYETFNRSDVHLIDVAKEPITVTDDGKISAGGEVFDLDVLIFATGFDAGTGAIAGIDVRGLGGHSLVESWVGGTRTHLGVARAGFPNLLFVYGPQTPYANQPPCVEQTSRWIVDLIAFMKQRGLSTVEGDTAVEHSWAQTLLDTAETTIFTETADSVRPWFMGTNVEGRAKEVAVYFGGYDKYYDLLDQVRADDFDGLVFR